MTAAFLPAPRILSQPHSLSRPRASSRASRPFRLWNARRCVVMAATQASFPFTVINARGEKLSAVYTSPITTLETGAEDIPFSSDILVLCHGFQSSKASTLLTHIRQAVNHATVSFDFSGNGESEGMFRFANYVDEVGDLRAVITHIRAHGGDVRYIAGHSKGGNVVLLYAARFRDVDIVFNLAARFDMRRGVRQRFGEETYTRIMAGGCVPIRSKRNGKVWKYSVCKKDIQSRFDINMKNAVQSIDSSVQIVTIHGDHDEIIPVEDGHEVYNHAKNGQLTVLKDVDHRFSGAEAAVVDVISGALQVQQRKEAASKSQN